MQKNFSKTDDGRKNLMCCLASLEFLSLNESLGTLCQFKKNVELLQITFFQNYYFCDIFLFHDLEVDLNIFATQFHFVMDFVYATYTIL